VAGAVADDIVDAAVAAWSDRGGKRPHHPGPTGGARGTPGRHLVLGPTPTAHGWNVRSNSARYVSWVVIAPLGG
jgi:hypothetical protein